MSGPVWSSWRGISGSIKRSRGSRPNMHRWAASSRRWELMWFGWCGPASSTGVFGLWSCGSLQEEEPFNPDYVEVDRILDVSHSVDKDNGEVGRKTDICFWLGKRLVFSKWTLINFTFFPLSERYLLLSEVVLPTLWRCNVGTEWGRGRGQGWRVQKNSEQATSTEEDGRQ